MSVCLWYIQLSEHKNLPSLQWFIGQNVISLGTTKNIAGSGLDFSCLSLACKRNRDGIYALFTEKSLNYKFVRVANSKRILVSVNDFFLCLWMRVDIFFQPWNERRKFLKTFQCLKYSLHYFALTLAYHIWHMDLCVSLTFMITIRRWP